MFLKVQRYTKNQKNRKSFFGFYSHHPYYLLTIIYQLLTIIY